MTAYDLRFWHRKKTNRQCYMIQCVCVVYYFITLIHLWAGQWQHCVGNRNRCGQAVGLQHSMTIPVCLTSHADILCKCVCVWTVAGQIQAGKTNKHTRHVLRWRPTQLFYTNKIPSVALIPKQLCNYTHTVHHKHWYEDLYVLY